MPRRSEALIVCSILPYPPVSGSQKRTMELLEAIERAGARPQLIVTTGIGREEHAATLRDRGWGVEMSAQPRSTPISRMRQHIRRLPSPYVPAAAQRLRELTTAATAFVQFEHAQNAYYPVAAADVPVVFSAHNVDAEMVASISRGASPLSLERWRLRFRATSMRSAERSAAVAADAVLCVTEHDAGEFERLGARRVLVIPNGVDDALFEIGPPPENSENVLFFGSLSFSPNERGIAQFVREGWPLLARERPRAVLRIAGAGGPAELKRELKESQGVEFVGEVPDMASELARANLVVVPIWQGAGTRLKVIESLAAGRAVVGTPLGVERIGFEHARHGLVGEQAEDLARLAATLLADPDRGRAMGAEGRVLAGRYRWRDIVRPAEELYRSWTTAA